MAESEKDAVPKEVGEEENPDYKPPAPKAIDEIIKQDQDDESLNEYKKKLLGENPNYIIGK